MNKIINFFQNNKKLMRIVIIFLLAALVALLALNANTNWLIEKLKLNKIMDKI